MGINNITQIWIIRTKTSFRSFFAVGFRNESDIIHNIIIGRMLRETDVSNWFSWIGEGRGSRWRSVFLKSITAPDWRRQILQQILSLLIKTLYKRAVAPLYWTAGSPADSHFVSFKKKKEQQFVIPNKTPVWWEIVFLYFRELNVESLTGSLSKL